MKLPAEPAVNSVLVLKADDIGVAEIQVGGRAAVGIEIVLGEFETHFIGIIVARFEIVDRSDKRSMPGNSAATALRRSEVNVAMPQRRGR